MLEGDRVGLAREAAGREERLQLGAEEERAVADPVVDRLLSEAVAREDEAAPRRVRRRFRVPGWLALLLSNNKSRLGLAMVGLVVVVAAIAPWISVDDPNAFRLTSPWTWPFDIRWGRIFSLVR